MIWAKRGGAGQGGAWRGSSGHRANSAVKSTPFTLTSGHFPTSLRPEMLAGGGAGQGAGRESQGGAD
ncbi:hypothetical protein E2C01_011201 [Portunus trituberculatus]|uniref:Uncharacterized protein n=1 Tax=Portunus trituberculatus TaxID=210409 RepID=A0A5B7DAM1_PORTR|nr:hypothetical protein [Portunus trituberculatus]